MELETLGEFKTQPLCTQPRTLFFKRYNSAAQRT